MAYSGNLCKWVLSFVARGSSKAEAAHRFDVHLRTVLLAAQPELNPIEKFWANLKRQWRNNAKLSLAELVR